MLWVVRSWMLTCRVQAPSVHTSPRAGPGRSPNGQAAGRERSHAGCQGDAQRRASGGSLSEEEAGGLAPMRLNSNFSAAAGQAEMSDQNRC